MIFLSYSVQETCWVLRDDDLRLSEHVQLISSWSIEDDSHFNLQGGELELKSQIT